MKPNSLKYALLILPLAVANATAAQESSPMNQFLASEQAFDGQLNQLSVPQLQSQQVQLSAQIKALQLKLNAVSARIDSLKLANSGQEKIIKPIYTKRIDSNEYGYNHSNPTWTGDGQYLGYERHDERSKEILITDMNGEIVQTVKYQSEEKDDLGLGLLLPEFADNVSYNSGLSWSPDSHQFVFMSNGAEGNYDLYVGSLGHNESIRMTMNSEKDGHANWSPTSQHIAFISGRNGSANIYLLDTISKQTKQVSNDSQSFLYPQWSPKGNQLAVIGGSNENHNIFIYDDVLNKPKSRQLISWEYDDLRPIWSPDGQKIAFYTNYNEQNDPKIWSIAVVDASSQPLSTVDQIKSHIIATNIIPDVDKGPAWTPDSANIVYVKNNRKQYNPIEIVNIHSAQATILDTDTRINHDISVSKNGLVAFRSQVEQWDHIFVSKLPELSNPSSNTSGL